jgi:hypothetical protein
MKDSFALKTIKLKNRRTSIGRGIKTDNVLLQFKGLRNAEDKEEQYSNSVFYGKTVRTSVVLSKSAAVALYLLLKDELKLSDIVEFENMSGQKVLK